MSDSVPSPSYLIDKILQSHQVHILGGPSGAGKSRWLLETFTKWSLGFPVLSYPSHPVPWMYVNSDRNQEDLDEILRSLEIPRHNIPILPAWDLALGYSGVMDAVTKAKAKFIVWEGFGNLAGDRPNSFTVTNLLRTITRDLQKHDMTLLGTNEQPKMKPSERYLNPRQRIAGPAAWAHHSSTVFLLEFGREGKPEDPARHLYVCPRHGANMVYEAAMTKTGRVVVLDPNSTEKAL